MRHSYFYGFYSNQPYLCFANDWFEFCETMRGLSEVSGYKPSPKEYDKYQGLISAAIYQNEYDFRANDNVVGWDLLILDIDDTNKNLDEINDIFSSFHRLFYSSASCTHAKLKLRVVIPLDSTAPADKLKEIWYAAQMWCGGLIDKQTKDISRLHYIPARYTNKGDDYRHFFKVNTGVYLNWKGLIEKYPMPPASDRFKQNNPLKKLKRKIFVDNNPLPCFDIQSTDCKFVWDSMLKEYALLPDGSHHLGMYRFLVKVCYNAQKMNYPLTCEELTDMGVQLDEIDGGFYDEKKIQNSSYDAMDFVGL